MVKILDVEADPDEAATLAALLADEFRLIHCPDPARAAQAVRREAPAAILFDPARYAEAGHRALEALARSREGPPVIVMSARAEPSRVLCALRRGAYDFLARPCGLHELKSALRAAVEARTYACAPFTGSSPALRKAAALLADYARHEYPVLILGESGTGKDVAARALHEASPRRGGPFVARNCAALPDELIESELFGSDRGAFTGAVERPGAFELAEGGTLFLDEIGEAGPAVQAKLLRALESGEVWRLGGRSSRKADIRLVTATSRDIRGAAEAGRFRPDLLYRIDTLVLELPPLRDRPEDIVFLAESFAREATRGRKSLRPAALERLKAAPWPGNIRQLKNVVHRAVVLSGDLEEIGEEHIVI